MHCAIESADLHAHQTINVIARMANLQQFLVHLNILRADRAAVAAAAAHHHFCAYTRDVQDSVIELKQQESRSEISRPKEQTHIMCEGKAGNNPRQTSL